MKANRRIRKQIFSAIAVCGAALTASAIVGADVPPASALVLGLEDGVLWTPNLPASSLRTQGDGALSVRVSGWTEIVSAPLAGVGDVGYEVRLDVLPPAAVSWGEVRLILQLPSAGEHWRDLGGVPLAGTAAGSFRTFSWAISPDLAAKLRGSYTDLKLRLVVNGPDGDYVLDNIRFSPDVGGGTGGASGEAFTVEIPDGTRLTDYAIITSESLDLEDRSTILTADGGHAKVTNAGSGKVTVGSHAESGTVRSRIGGVFLREGAHVYGDVHTGGSFETQSTWTVDGDLIRTPFEGLAVRRTVEFPVQAVPPVHLEPGVQAPQPLAPGYYQALELKAGAKITLAPGNYYFDAVTLHPGAVVNVNDAQGPVVVTVRNALSLQGAFLPSEFERPSFTLLFLGSSSVLINAPFRGTLFAPGGDINLEGGLAVTHEGAFFARNVRLAPDTKLIHRPPAWLITNVTVNKSQVCSGESVTATVEAADPGGQPVEVIVNGARTTTFSQAFVGDAGTRDLYVSAATPDGLIESRVVTVEVQDCPVASARPLFTAVPDLLDSDEVVLTVVNAAAFENDPVTYTWAFGDGSTLDTPWPSVNHDFNPSQRTTRRASRSR